MAIRYIYRFKFIYNNSVFEEFYTSIEGAEEGRQIKLDCAKYDSDYSDISEVSACVVWHRESERCGS